MKLNKNFDDLAPSYLFAETGRRLRAFREAYPGADIIRLGIGDVTLPLCKASVDAMRGAAAEMGTKEGFRGYGPDDRTYGYDFLIEAIKDYYRCKGADVDSSEIFISDGAKSDLGNILDLFSSDNTVLIPDPVYPAYLDANIMDGRRVAFADAVIENGFCPPPPENLKADIIYLCSPNNPTGAVYDREQLGEWVDYALENDSLIIFDAAYEAFIADPALPSSIYLVEGADRCAVEICSFSKTAGFTGTRCGYTVIPQKLIFGGKSLNRLWARRQSTKFNGVGYIVQRGAAAVLTPEGLRQSRENIEYYRGNARVIRQTLEEKGIRCSGGLNSPYIWLECPGGMGSWDFFSLLLEKAGVWGTPGAGFGKNGEGFFRLSAFGDRERTAEAMRRIKDVL